MRSKYKMKEKDVKKLQEYAIKLMQQKDNKKVN
jgi:hypothetical protein